MTISTETIIAISSAVQTVTTAALVIITYKQVGQAQKSLAAVERSIKANFLPILTLGLNPTHSDDKHLTIRLTNCGKGIAIKPKVIFPGQADLIMNSIDVGESQNATRDYNMEFVRKKTQEHEKKIVIEYNDVFNRKIVTEADLVEMENLGVTGKEKGIAWETWKTVLPNE